MKLKRGDIVYCKWLDHKAVGNWQPEENMLDHGLVPIESVGFYLGGDKKKMTLVQQHGLDDGGLVADAIIIGKKDIESIKRLKKSDWSK